MDKSETYIKMRRMAIADLGMGIPIECPCNYVGNDVWVDSKGDWYYSTEVEGFQLERQDQLQEMIDGDYIDKLLDLFKAVRDFELSKYHYAEDEFPYQSMEQLWLAFVMKEKYNKTWSGTDWVCPG